MKTDPTLGFFRKGDCHLSSTLGEHLLDSGSPGHHWLPFGSRQTKDLTQTLCHPIMLLGLFSLTALSRERCLIREAMTEVSDAWMLLSNLDKWSNFTILQIDWNLSTIYLFITLFIKSNLSSRSSHINVDRNATFRMCSFLRSTVAVMLVPCVQAWAASWTTASAEMYCRSSVGWRVCHCKQLLGIPIDAHFFGDIWFENGRRKNYATNQPLAPSELTYNMPSNTAFFEFDQHLVAGQKGVDAPSLPHSTTSHVWKRGWCLLPRGGAHFWKTTVFGGRTGKNPSKRRLFPQRRDFTQIIFEGIKFEGKVRRYSQLQRYAEIGEGLAVPAPMESRMHQLIAHFFLLIIWKRSNRKWSFSSKYRQNWYVQMLVLQTPATCPKVFRCQETNKCNEITWKTFMFRQVFWFSQCFVWTSISCVKTLF